MSEPKHGKLPPMQSRDDDTVPGVRPLGPPPPMPQRRQKQRKGDYGEPWRWVGCDTSCDVEGCEHDETTTLRLESKSGYILNTDVFGGVAFPLIGDEDQVRIVACVNALAGRDPETVKRQLEERDKLLAMCKALVDHERTNRYGGLAAIPDDCFVAAKAEIAKAEKPK